MATKTSRIIFDCSTLPYSREAAAISSPALKRMEKSLPARSDDPDTFHLRQLIGRPILQWPPTIPEYDLQGVRSSESFECWKKARDGRTIASMWMNRLAWVCRFLAAIVQAKNLPSIRRLFLVPAF